MTIIRFNVHTGANGRPIVTAELVPSTPEELDKLYEPNAQRVPVTLDELRRVLGDSAAVDAIRFDAEGGFRETPGAAQTGRNRRGKHAAPRRRKGGQKPVEQFETEQNDEIPP